MSEEIPQEVCVRSEKPGEPQHLWDRWKERRMKMEKRGNGSQGPTKEQGSFKKERKCGRSGFSREIEPKILRDLF